MKNLTTELKELKKHVENQNAENVALRAKVEALEGKLDEVGGLDLIKIELQKKDAEKSVQEYKTLLKESSCRAAELEEIIKNATELQK